MNILPTHTCFDDVLDFYSMLRDAGETPAQLDAWVVMHALCIMPGTDDDVFAHAWNQHRDTGACMQAGYLSDEGIGAWPERIWYEMPAESFAEMFRPQLVTRYTLTQALDANIATGHYGPWLHIYHDHCNRSDKPRVAPVSVPVRCEP